MSELLSMDDVQCIVSKIGNHRVLDWKIEKASNSIIGYLGEHLKLIIDVETNVAKSTIKLFIKCVPRFNLQKAKYLKETNFFEKEFFMLSVIFTEFSGDHGDKKWRPKVLFLRENLFVFEDVTELGYTMPHAQKTMKHEDIKAVVISMAQFHAQSFIFEENKSKALKRPYTLWDDYSYFLTEPAKSQNWRDTGRNAIMEYSKKYSKYKSSLNFDTIIKESVPRLYDKALKLMEPSSKYKNAIVHRDLWTNNIFLKKVSDSTVRALIIDFQTVIYCSPMLDLSSFLYFISDHEYRQRHLEDLLNLYHEVLESELALHGLLVEHYFDKETLNAAYEESILFGITQACLIIPTTLMDSDLLTKTFTDPESSYRFSEVSRNAEVLEASKNENYRYRITELFDELVYRYINLT